MPTWQIWWAWRRVSLDAVDAKDDAVSQDSEIDIWLVPTRGMARLAVTHRNLSNEEEAHVRTLRRESDRVRYVAVHSLLRAALSHRTKSSTGRWHFRTNAFGKPELECEHGPLSFNITHAGAFSVLAVATRATIGIDAERVDAARLKHLPFDCFSPREQSHLRRLPESRRHIDFFKLWTLKEAYAKALGLGFSAAFDRIEFGLDPVRLTREAPNADPHDTKTIELASIDFDGETYFLATCLLNSALSDTARKTFFLVEA